MADLPTAGSLGMDPDCDLFRQGDPSFHSMTILSKAGFPAGCCIIGYFAVLIQNMQNNRPLYTGFHRYGIATVIGLLAGMYGNRLRYSYMAEKDFQYYHYMTLHPEDFQAKEKVKYKNYLTIWVPWR